MKKDNFFTIPNMMSLFRLVLIPVIIYVYMEREQNILATILIIVSALSDIFDGIIARKFNMTSEYGKILDPLADKMTQLSLAICISIKYPLVRVLLGIFFVKEISQLILMRQITKRSSTIVSAKWFGKLCTVAQYVSMMILFVCHRVPDFAVAIIVGICSTLLVISLIGYIRLAKKIFKEYPSNQVKA